MTILRTHLRRLIEVDLPIKRISEHARREKDMRRGHVPLLHIWPATRPTSACRAIVLASLLPDPAGSGVADSYLDDVRTIMRNWTRATSGSLVAKQPGLKFDRPIELRTVLLDFIAEFSRPENAVNPLFLEVSRALVKCAHETLGGTPGTRPLVLDSFSGGGAIPLESLRVGAEAYSNDINPVAVLLQKVMLEYVPRFGTRLIDELNSWCSWVKQESARRLEEFYPKGKDGTVSTAYIWARTILSEAPGGSITVEIPLFRSMWLSKRNGRNVAFRWVRDSRGCVVTKTEQVEYADGRILEVLRPTLEIFYPKSTKEVEAGTVAGGAATCPLTGHTTPVASVRAQMRRRRGGSRDARLIAVVTMNPGERGRFFRLPIAEDLKALSAARNKLLTFGEDRMPNEPLPPDGALGFRIRKYGMEQWKDLFMPRQLLALVTFMELIDQYIDTKLAKEQEQYRFAVAATLALVLDKLIDNNAAMCMWQLNTPNAAHVFGRWALPMVWDFAEVNPISEAGGSPTSLVKKAVAGLAQLDLAKYSAGTVMAGDSGHLSLPDSSVQAFITDPPYYDAIGYGDLMDFFYVWLKRLNCLRPLDLFGGLGSPKPEECIVDPARNKDRTFFESKMGQSLLEARRVLVADGVGVIVFAHKSTEGWEAILQAIIDAGWAITSSWPIDTEMEFRMRGRNSAALASSVHLVCRPRVVYGKNGGEVGDWRDVLEELPRRIHEWMPRLAEEGVVGADAIFACIGPALEIFSRYSRVEKANGETVALREYLEQVWAAVAKEALTMVFHGADAAGFEPDARLTAIWLWTLATPNGSVSVDQDSAVEEPTDDAEDPGKKGNAGGYVLEYDAARKIAQGLGIQLEDLDNVVEINGEVARLLSLPDRSRYLLGKDESKEVSSRKKKVRQATLFPELEEAEEKSAAVGVKSAMRPGATVLDKVHQSMILFAAGRGEALKRFLVEDGIGQDSRFWKLAQALCALYPSGSDEKRWAEGVLARKKSLGV